ncbi:hypothetical protein AC579_7048 [Pseudocercospora musae]|uniref:Myb-like domain-containing protein n=1 Tax=Pseudocercospora musae TaxID=113226 RepID=A0A139IAK4_9PEZI|nr:hypothetical protein AC579_7048 [Pseudocercospora musae]
MGTRLGSIGCILFRPSIRHGQIGLHRLALQKQCSFTASTNDWERFQQWTEEEDRVVVQQSEKGSTTRDISSLLRNRSVSAVVNRRRMLAIKGLLTKYTPRNEFTPDEDSRLLAARSQGLSYTFIGTLLPHRQKTSLYRRVAMLTTSSSRKRRARSWSAEEDALLLDLVKWSPTRWKDIADRLSGRSIQSMRARYRLLVGYTKRSKFNGVSQCSIAINLGRSLISVQNQIPRWQASNGDRKSPPPWTQEEKSSRQQCAAKVQAERI